MSQARRIGPFALRDLIGESHETALYRAHRSESNRQPTEVCIRIAKNPLNESVSADIKTEYDILKAMDNPRIPNVYGHYSDEAAVATTYLAGVNLQEVIEAQRDGVLNLATGTAIDIVIEVAHALRHASNVIDSKGRRIVHGHLRPSQIRIETDGSIILVGFGAKHDRLNPTYAAPEIVKGETPTPQSDQWALACILMEMINGEAVYSGVGDPLLTAREGDVSHWIMNAVQKHPELEQPLTTMLSLDPADRFERGHQLLKSLLAAGRKIGGIVNRRSVVNRVHARKKDHGFSAAVPEQFGHQTSPLTEPDLSGIDFSQVIEPEAMDSTEPLSSALTVKPARPSVPPASPPPPTAQSAVTPTESFFSPPAPDPVPNLLPSEFAGITLGGLMVLLGLTYVFWVL